MSKFFLLNLRRLNSKKLKAGALAYALIVSAFIAVSCGLLVLVITIKRNQQLSQFEKIKLVNNLKSGTVLLLSGSTSEFEKPIELFSGETDLVELKRSNWGLMELNTVRAWTLQSKDTLSRAFFSGTKTIEKNSALYLKDASLPLFIGGKSIIKGGISHPKAGMKTGFMEGVPFSGKLEGKERISNATFPVDFSSVIQKVNFDEHPESAINFQELPLTVFRSFTEPTMMISDQSFNIGGKNLSGNITIQADRHITVEASAHLEDIILIAPKITIKKGFSGSFQAFAKEELIVEENCELKYPSVLGLIPQKINTSKNHLPILSLDKKANISGLLFSTVKKGLINRSLIKIQKEATVTGAIFTDGTLEHRGIVNGTVVCGGLNLKTNTKEYRNTLFDAVIDNKSISDFFIPPVVFENENEKTVIKWLE